MIELRPFNHEQHSLLWDNFAKDSRNATFLLQRGYMDYHSHRFEDSSLMAYKNGSLIAMLPANITPDGMLHSHSGLTYGGWILPVRHFSGVSMMMLMESLCQWGATRKLRGIDYKPIPYIYHRLPACDDEYALWRMGASVTAEGLSSTIDLCDNPGFNQLQRRMLRRASDAGCVAREMGRDEIPAFWNLLAECLAARHKVAPVHSADELALLAGRFPENIRFYGAFSPSGELGAALCLYISDRVAHSQYIATSELGRETGMLPLVVRHAIETMGRDHRYFDFGISTEDNGRYLNEGLNMQKSSFGGGGVVYRRYELLF